VIPPTRVRAGDVLGCCATAATRHYLHLVNDWLVNEFDAIDAIDAGADLLELRASAVTR